MKDLAYLNKFFYKYRWRLIPGILFVIASNIFAVLLGPVIRIAFDMVADNITIYQLFNGFDRQAEIYKIFGAGLLLIGVLVFVLSVYAANHYPDVAPY
jgi:ATP-binding cassette subfamily B multidrug efflux pump